MTFVNVQTNRRRKSSTMTLVVVLALLTLLSTITCRNPELNILPVDPVQVKPVGSNVLLTCLPQVDDKNLVTNLEWHDTLNRSVSNNNVWSRGRLTTDVMPGGLALIINALQDSDAGTYTCTATYANSVSMVKSVTLETILAITWVDAPTEQFTTAGKNYRVKCKVTANPAPLIDWLKNGEPIPEGSNYITETEGLLIQNAQEGDDGTYTCRAIVIETGELKERHIHVEVQTLPVFEVRGEENNRVEVIEGETASIECRAQAKPLPTYYWVKAATQQKYMPVNDRLGTLVINRVSFEDNGDWRCVASNSAGIAEKMFNLVVITKPQVLDIKNISVPVTREARLECRATGNPPPVLEFKKLAQNQKQILSVEHFTDNTLRQVIAHLVIPSVKRTDDGLYACVATNKGGQARKNGHLTVEFEPTFLNTPMKEAWSWSRLPVNLTCMAESIPNATITWQRNNRDIEFNPTYKKFGQGPISTLQVTPVDSRYYGKYRCLARNQHGLAWHEITLQEARIPSDVQQAKVEIATATTITFSIVGPTDSGGRPIKAYSVQYKFDDMNWNAALNKTWSVDAPYILENLQPTMSYVFRFAAANDVGIGNWGAITGHKMPQRSYPEEPKIIKMNPMYPENYILSPYEDKYELRWNVPADNGEYINMYVVKYCVVRRRENTWSETGSGCQTLELKSSDQASVELSNLFADTFYKVELRAHNAIGYSLPGQIILKTARDPSTIESPLYSTSLKTSRSCGGVRMSGLLVSMCMLKMVLLSS